MTDIDFYILSAQEPQQRLDFACRLVEKAYRSRCKVLVQLPNQAEAKAFDELLWSYRDSSFIPHRLLDGAASAADSLAENESANDAESCRVHIAFDQQTPPHFDVLINLADEIPTTFARYQRVLEVVIQQDAILEATRNHYRFYKERGYPINNIDMRMKD